MQYIITYTIPGVLSFAPFEERIEADSESEARSAFYELYPEYVICMVE